MLCSSCFNILPSQSIMSNSIIADCAFLLNDNFCKIPKVFCLNIESSFS